MRRDVALAVILRGGAAAAWLCYVWFLSRVLPQEALGTVLYALALSGLVAGVLAAGWAGRLLREGARAAADLDAAAFGAILGRASLSVAGFGMLALALVTGLAALGYLPALTPFWPLAPLTGVAAILTAIIGCLAAAQRARGALVRALAAQGLGRAVLPLAATAALAHWMAPDPVLALALYLAALCTLAVALLPGLPRPRLSGTAGAGVGALWRAQAGGIFYQHLDVLVLGWVFGPAEAAAYLVARRIAGLLTVLFDALRSALAPRLAVAFTKPEAFAVLSARVNLAFLLFGAAGTGLLAVLGPFVLPHFGAGLMAISPVFLWLVLGQAAPAIFGATGMLMVMTDMERDRARLVWCFAPLALGLMVWAATFGVVGLAIAAALSQLVLAAASAAMLAARHGVLPGATALLHVGLRLGSRLA